MVDPGRPCRRPGCGHYKHTHLHGNGQCSVKRVSGPASDAGHPTYENGEMTGYEHVGRTEIGCACPGFVG